MSENDNVHKNWLKGFTWNRGSMVATKSSAFKNIMLHVKVSKWQGREKHSNTQLALIVVMTFWKSWILHLQFLSNSSIKIIILEFFYDIQHWLTNYFKICKQKHIFHLQILKNWKELKKKLHYSLQITWSSTLVYKNIIQKLWSLKVTNKVIQKSNNHVTINLTTIYNTDP